METRDNRKSPKPVGLKVYVWATNAYTIGMIGISLAVVVACLSVFMMHLQFLWVSFLLLLVSLPFIAVDVLWGEAKRYHHLYIQYFDYCEAYQLAKHSAYGALTDEIERQRKVIESLRLQNEQLEEHLTSALQYVETMEKG